jgi:hypothetical protein
MPTVMETRLLGGGLLEVDLEGGADGAGHVYYNLQILDICLFFFSRSKVLLH